MRYLAGLIAGIALCEGVESNQELSPPQRQTHFEEALLARIPPDVVFKPDTPLGHDRWKDAVFSPDGRTVAYPARKGERYVVVVNDKQGPEHTAVSWIVFSPKGDRHAYVASEALVFSDGTRLGIGEAAGPPVFSQDGKTVGFSGRKGTKGYVYVGGKRFGEEFGEGEDIETRLEPLVLGPDSNSIAYVVHRFDPSFTVHSLS